MFANLAQGAVNPHIADCASNPLNDHDPTMAPSRRFILPS